MAMSDKDHPKIASSDDGMTFISKAKDCSTCKHEVFPMCKHPKEGKKGWSKMTMADCYEIKKYRKKTNN